MMTAELIAHRGGVVTRRTEENTMQALEAAAAAGYAGVEIDVRETADHVPVLHHEARFRRGIRRGRRIADLSYDELAEYATSTGADAPLTFEEAAAYCEGRLRIMLEVKEPNPSDAYLDEISASLERHGLTDRLLVIGTAAGKRHFGATALTGIRAEPLRNDPSSVSALAATRFLFDHGNVLTSEDCRTAMAAGMLVVPSVNTFHYRTEPAAVGARRDIARLIADGVTLFQIDSVFARFFDV